jgi:hypothetical protein
MRKLIYILTVLIFSCDSEDANDCIQTAGNIIQLEAAVSDFERILVNRDIELIITEASEYKVTIETGENLLNDVKAEVLGNRLVLTDNNTCNYVRDYGITKVYVEAPNITEIRNSSQYQVSSNGVITYPTLNLISENFNENIEFTVGDYNLSINNQNLRVSSNGLASFYIDGATENLAVNFFAGDGRFEGQNLVSQSVTIYHRGSNDMIVNPIESLSVELRGTGNVIATNEPPIVQLEQFYIGQLIFN